MKLKTYILNLVFLFAIILLSYKIYTLPHQLYKLIYKNINSSIDTLNTSYINTQAKSDVSDKSLVSSTINIKTYSSHVLNLGTENEDWKPAFDIALSNNDKIYVPTGVYRTSAIKIVNGKTIYGDGEQTIFITNNSNIFNIYGSNSKEINISNDIDDFSNIISVIDASILRPNDYILLKGQKDSLSEIDSGDWTLGYSTPSVQGAPFGEFLEIESIDKDTIITKTNTIFPSYRTNNVSEKSSNSRNYTTISKVDFVNNVSLRDFSIRGLVPNKTMIDLDYALDCVISNVKLESNNYTDGLVGFISFKNSLNCEARNCYFKIANKIKPSKHYYVNIYKCISSTNCGFYRCYAYNATQAIDFTYSEMNIPSINCYADSCTIEYCSQTGITSHGGTYQCRFVNNIIRGTRQGITCRTRNSIISNNLLLGTFSPSNTSHFGIGLYEGQAVDCIVSNNTIINFNTGISVSDAVYLGETFKYCGAIISNNSIKNCLNGIAVSKNSNKVNKDMSIKITGNIIQTSQNFSGAKGIRLSVIPGGSIRGILIKENIITANKVEGTGIWADYDCTNIKIISNTIRRAKTGILIKGVNSQQELFEADYTTYYDLINEFINVNIPIITNSANLIN